MFRRGQRGEASSGALSSSGAALAESLIEDDGAGCGNVEGADASGHGNAEEVVAGAADEVVEACALAAEDENAVAGEVEAVVVLGASFVETDGPDVAGFQVFKGANEVDDASDAEVFGGAGAGFDGGGRERGGTALGEDDAIDAGAVGDAKERAEVLRVLDAVESEEQACLSVCGGRREEEVLDGEEFLRMDEGDYALVGVGSGQLGELLARLLADADAGLAAGGGEALEACGLMRFEALASEEDVIETAAAGAKSFFDRVDAV